MCEQKIGGPEAVAGPQGGDPILEDRLVVYLDLLGFGDKGQWRHDAARLDMHGLNEIMRQWLGDPDCGAVEYALPMSDSYFFVAKPGRELDFLSKMGLAMREGLLWSYAKDGNETVDPNSGSKRDDAMNAAVKNVRVLPRGGMARGKVQVIPRAVGIWDGRRFTTRNLLGEAVTAAAGLEKSGKGPRMFCDRCLAGSLPEECRHLFTAPGAGPYEFLWPLAYFRMLDDSGKDFANGPFDELWSRAMELFRDAEPGSLDHCRELLKVIIISTERWAIAKRAVEDLRVALLNCSYPLKKSNPPKFVLDMVEAWR